MATTSGNFRIGVDLHTLEGLHQGSRTHCLELYSRVPRLMPDCQFFFFADYAHCDQGAIERLKGPNVTMIEMPHKDPFRRLGIQLPGFASRHRLDLLHTQYISPLWLGCASAVTVHDILLKSFLSFLRSSSRSAPEYW